MLNYIRENIDYTHEQAKLKINLVLNNLGYDLVTEDHNHVGIETKIFQWTNSCSNHCIQLIWDGKENWFDLGDFNFHEGMNYLNATRIVLVPINTARLFNRKSYFDEKINILLRELHEKINKINL